MPCGNRRTASPPRSRAAVERIPGSAGASASPKQARKRGRQELLQALYRGMRQDPTGMVRNVDRELRYMLTHAAGGMVFVTAHQVLYHLQLTIPRARRVFVLDATANPELLGPLFAPRPVEVRCTGRI